jgi:hypothetical protein
MRSRRSAASSQASSEPRLKLNKKGLIFALLRICISGTKESEKGSVHTMNGKKNLIAYSLLSILTLFVIVFLFFFLSADLKRDHLFYFQLGYSVFLAVLFWGYMMSSVRVTTDNGGTRSALTGGAIFAYIVISAIVMGVYSGLINNPKIISHTHYYAVVIVLTFVFILIPSLGNIFASRDAGATAALEKPRLDLKTLASTIEDCRMDSADLLAGCSASERKQIESEFRLTIELLKRKVPDKSKLAITSKIEEEVTALSGLIKNRSGDFASGSVSLLKNIQNFAGRM